MKKPIDMDTLLVQLDRLKLTAIRDQLDTLLDEAARSKMTLREALSFLVTREIARRDERRISMSSKLAQFPFVRELDSFDFEAQPSIDPKQIRDLAASRWIANGENVLLLGPPGVGKTHLLASAYYALPGDGPQTPTPKAFATFGELTQLAGVFGFAECVELLAGYTAVQAAAGGDAVTHGMSLPR